MRMQQTHCRRDTSVLLVKRAVRRGCLPMLHIMLSLLASASLWAQTGVTTTYCRIGGGINATSICTTCVTSGSQTVCDRDGVTGIETGQIPTAPADALVDSVYLQRPPCAPNLREYQLDIEHNGLRERLGYQTLTTSGYASGLSPLTSFSGHIVEAADWNISPAVSPASPNIWEIVFTMVIEWSVRRSTPVVKNSTFETGGALPWSLYSVSTDAAANVVRDPHMGQFGLAQSGLGTVFQDIQNLVPGRTYSIAVWNKSPPLDAYRSRACKLAVHNTKDGNIVEAAAIANSPGWRRSRLLYTADHTGQVRIHLTDLMRSPPGYGPRVWEARAN
jgi:hypothetical protein